MTQMRTAGNAKVIAGVDPGTKAMGLSIILAEGDKVSLIEACVLRGRATDSRTDRLCEIFGKLFYWLSCHSVKSIALERAYVGKDPQAAIALGEARGIAIAAAAKMHPQPEIREYAPSEARKAVGLKGSADKIAVRRMVLRILGADDLSMPLDASDATCLAIACAWAPLSTAELVARAR